MSLEEKFNAAVNVIRSLPKSGSYQPSNELMLRFYSYFKQASEGPCDKPKPGFWDVVNRAKWESWNKLGDMSREEAMQSYVNELHKIVETMSYSSDVASFLSVDDTDEDFPNGDLELVAGDVLRRVRSEHNSPVGSRSESGASSPVPQARLRNDSEDEFIDTVDSEPENAERLPLQEQQQQSQQQQQNQQQQNQQQSQNQQQPLNQQQPQEQNEQIPQQQQHHAGPRLSNGHAHQITSQLTHLKVLEQLPGTLARLEADVAALRKAVEGEKAQSQKGWRWPWQELSPTTLALLVLWPLVVFRYTANSRRRT